MGKMEIFSEISHIRPFLSSRRKPGPIGLVPTMGALHPGHLSLIEASKNENETTVCSIFVNPAQFNNPEDLKNYPRLLEKDIDLLEKAGCHALFCPEVSEMYGATPPLSFDFGHLDKVMEGKFRPGHFSGVALAVSKLLNIVQPDHAYFGQKDWQQCTIIHRLAEDLKFPVALRCIPTLREPDGLAMSSRNLRLNGEQRKKALVFYRALEEARKALLLNVKVEEVKKQVEQTLEKEKDVRLEYFEIADRDNLLPLPTVERGSRPILCIAGFVGEVRLIDNVLLDL